MTRKQRSEKWGLQPAEEEANRMDWPVPGSGDTPSPEPVATGFTELIDAAAEASGPRGRAKSAASRKPVASGKR